MASRGTHDGMPILVTGEVSLTKPRFSRTPKSRCNEGERKSASTSKTRWPSCARAMEQVGGDGGLALSGLLCW